MGVQVLSPESPGSRQFRALPKLQRTAQYSMKAMNTLRPTRVLPIVPCTSITRINRTDDSRTTATLPSLPRNAGSKKPTGVHRHGRMLPDVPVRDLGSRYTDTNAIPDVFHTWTQQHPVHNNNTVSVSVHAQQLHPHVHATPGQRLQSHATSNNATLNTIHGISKSQLSSNSHLKNHDVSNNPDINSNIRYLNNHVTNKTDSTTKNINNSTANDQNHRHQPAHTHDKWAHENQGTNAYSNQGQRALPRLPKLHTVLKQKPELNRIAHMHAIYKKEGDGYSDEGVYDKALNSYNLALKFVSDDIATILARSRVYRKLGKLRKAVQDVDIVLKLEPLYQEGLLQKADLMVEHGDYVGALGYFKTGAKMRPDHEDFHNGVEKVKRILAEHNKHARKRKNTMSTDDTSYPMAIKDKTGKSRKQKYKDNRLTSQAHRARSRASNNTNDTSHTINSSTQNTSHASSHDHSYRESTIHEGEPKPVQTPPIKPSSSNSATHGEHSKLVAAPSTKPRCSNVRSTSSKAERISKRRENASASQQQRMDIDDQREQMLPVPTSDADVIEDTRKHANATECKDKQYFEKFLDETDNMAIPGTGSTVQHELHFLYDRVLNWVRRDTAMSRSQPMSRAKRLRQTKSLVTPTITNSDSLENQHSQRLNDQCNTRRDRFRLPPTRLCYHDTNTTSEKTNENKTDKMLFVHVVEGKRMKQSKTSAVSPSPARRPQQANRLQRESALGGIHATQQKPPYVLNLLRTTSGQLGRRTSKDPVTRLSERNGQQKLLLRQPLQEVSSTSSKTAKQDRRRNVLVKYVTREVQQIDKLFNEARYNECGDKVKHLLQLLELEDWPNKHKYTALLHSYAGNLCVSKRAMTLGLEHHYRDLDIGQTWKIDEAVSRAFGNIGRVYVLQKRYQEALDAFLKKTPLCTAGSESAWLFHEISNCFLALNDFEYAKNAAKKSMEAAEQDLEWSYQLQSCVLLGVTEVKLRQYHAAFNTFEKALEQARCQGDDKAEVVIREALKDVNDRIVDEQRTKAPLHFLDSRCENYSTQLSRSTTAFTDYQLQGLSRSRAEIAKRQSELGPRFRADYAKSQSDLSELSSIVIPEDHGNVSLSDSVADLRDLDEDLERVQTMSTSFWSDMEHCQDSIRARSVVSAAKHGYF